MPSQAFRPIVTIQFLSFGPNVITLLTAYACSTPCPLFLFSSPFCSQQNTHHFDLFNFSFWSTSILRVREREDAVWSFDRQPAFTTWIESQSWSSFHAVQDWETDYTFTCETHESSHSHGVPFADHHFEEKEVCTWENFFIAFCLRFVSLFYDVAWVTLQRHLLPLMGKTSGSFRRVCWLLANFRRLALGLDVWGVMLVAREEGERREADFFLPLVETGIRSNRHTGR